MPPYLHAHTRTFFIRKSVPDGLFYEIPHVEIVIFSFSSLFFSLLCCFKRQEKKNIFFFDLVMIEHLFINVFLSLFSSSFLVGMNENSSRDFVSFCFGLFLTIFYITSRVSYLYVRARINGNCRALDVYEVVKGLPLVLKF